jgi:predicted dehydrogenase
VSGTNARPLDVIVIGAGMYVCGRGTDTFGTVLPALYQAKKDGIVGEVTICSTSKSSSQTLIERNKKLSSIFNDNIIIKTFPRKENKNNKSYLEALTSGSYDCGIVVVPDHLHHEVSKELIQKKIHTLIVKPLTPDLKSSLDLMELANSNGVYGAVEFHKRFDKSNLKIREFIKTNKIGDPLYILVEYSQRKTIPKEYFKKWVEHTNIFQYLGVHYVDIIYFCTGFIPNRVMATGQKNHLIKEGIDTFDSIQAIIEWKDKSSDRKFISTIHTNWIDPVETSAMSDQKIKIIGSTGRIECDQKNRGLRIVSDRAGIEDLNPYFSEFYSDIDDKSMNFYGYGCESVIQFLKDSQSLVIGAKSLKELSGLRPTFEDSLVSTAVIEAVNKSLSNHNSWIYLNEDRKILKK